MYNLDQRSSRAGRLGRAVRLSLQNGSGRAEDIFLENGPGGPGLGVTVPGRAEKLRPVQTSDLDHCDSVLAYVEA